jgi:hypothetical protein
MQGLPPSPKLATADGALVEPRGYVKFYRRSFFDVVEDEGGRYEGFVHVDDWV